MPEFEGEEPSFPVAERELASHEDMEILELAAEDLLQAIPGQMIWRSVVTVEDDAFVAFQVSHDDEALEKRPDVIITLMMDTEDDVISLLRFDGDNTLARDEGEETDYELAIELANVMLDSDLLDKRQRIILESIRDMYQTCVDLELTPQTLETDFITGGKHIADTTRWNTQRSETQVYHKTYSLPLLDGCLLKIDKTIFLDDDFDELPVMARTLRIEVDNPNEGLTYEYKVVGDERTLHATMTAEFAEDPGSLDESAVIIELDAPRDNMAARNPGKKDVEFLIGRLMEAAAIDMPTPEEFAAEESDGKA